MSHGNRICARILALARKKHRNNDKVSNLGRQVSKLDRMADSDDEAESPVLVCYRRHRSQDPVCRLICFPHAGGGPHAFAHVDLAQIETHVVSYSGRGSRFAEPFVQTFDEASGEAFSAIRAIADRPLVLLGHSFGALLAFDVATRLEKAGASVIRVIVSSCPEPSMKSDDLLSELVDAALVTELAKRGWLPSAASGEGGAALLTHALPPLRADLKLYESYTGAETKVRCGITAVGGADDASVPESKLSAWHRRCDPESFDVVLIKDAGHFHLESHRSVFSQCVETAVSTALNALPSSVLVGPPVVESQKKNGTVLTALVRAMELRPHSAALFEPSATAPRTAIPESTTTFTELLRLARHVAAVLSRDHNVKRGDVVAVYLPPSTAYVLANVAVFVVGGAVVYFEVNYTTALIDELLDASGAKCVLTNATLKKKGLDGLKQSSSSWGVLELQGMKPYFLSRQHGLHSEVVMDPSSLAYCSMSSGTTGKPKAILVEHHSVMHNFFVRDSVCPYSEDPDSDREACNVFFVWESLRAPVHGRVTVIVPDSVVVDARALAGFLKRHAITRCMLTPSLLRNLLDQPGLDAQRTLGGLRYLMLEGEVVPRQLVTDFAGRFDKKERPKLVNYYSTWESLDATAVLLDTTNEKFAPVGRPLPGVSVVVVDRKTRKVVPRGVPGFVQIVANSIARGYLGDDKKTKERFSPNFPELEGRCYDTGDRGVILDCGNLFLLGRADATVKIRGFKVALNYVETAALDSPEEEVRSCVVRPVIDQTTQQPQGLVAYVVPKKKNSPSFLRLVRDHLKRTLPEYAVPSHVVVLEALPTKPGSGKLDYARLPPPTENDRSVTSAPSSPLPSSPRARSSFYKVAAREIGLAFASALQRPDVPWDANFFELGGHSLHAATIVGTVAAKLGVELRVVDLFERPTVSALAAFLADARQASSGPASVVLSDPQIDEQKFPVAVTGAACFLPGARDVREFWHNLASSSDAVSDLNLEDLAKRGISEAVLNRSDFVPRAQKLDGGDVVSFDALFWGISASEATVMDPQHRKLLEVAWRAREVAGRGTRGGPDDDLYGVFAASGIDGYMIHHLEGATLKDIADPGSVFIGEVGSEKDYAPTRISYQFGLRGPSVAVNSACSSGLVATALAVSAINSGECPGAIVGASSITFPNLGYVYVDGLVGSKDGLVRPLDADASGTLFGDGIVAFCIEKAPDATMKNKFDRSAVAVIRGTGVTNDGRQKAGYTAPSAEAQALAMARSLKRAKSPKLDFIELHATATKLGDAIEVAGLERALSAVSTTAEVVLGSVKGNIGHANCAAGATGLLKTCLGLAHGSAPATVHFKKLNPRITKLPASAIIVADGCAPMALPKRDRLAAGVSSFGVGGTNAHVTLVSPNPRSGDAARDGGGYYGDLPRRRPRLNRRRIVLADDDMPLGAAAIAAKPSEAAAAATFAAMRDAAAAAAVKAGVPRAKAMHTVRKIWTSEQLLRPSLPDQDVPLVRVNSLDNLVGVFQDDSDDEPKTPTTPTRGVFQDDLDDEPKTPPTTPTNFVDMPRRSASDHTPVIMQQSSKKKKIEKKKKTPAKRKPPKRRRSQVIVVSARTEASLREATKNIAAFMRRCADEDEDVYLADVARTLQEGREHWYQWRVAVSARTLREAADKLEEQTPTPLPQKKGADDVVCLEIGGLSNAVHLGAGRALFDTHADFRTRLQACAAIVDAPLRQLPALGAATAPAGLLDALGYAMDEAEFRPDASATFAVHGRSSLIAAQATLARPAVNQPASFSLLYALAACFLIDDDHSADETEMRKKTRTLMANGFFAAVAGRGVGQLVALALDGAIALDDALLLCLERGRLIEEVPESRERGKALEAYLDRKFESAPQWLRPPHRAAIADNVSGQWLTAIDAVDPAYWRDHFIKDDKWLDNTKALDRWDPTVVLAVDLTSSGKEWSRQRARCALGRGDDADVSSICDALASAWLAGVDVDWRSARLSARGRRSLAREARFIAGVPGYAFDKTPFWMKPNASVYGPLLEPVKPPKVAAAKAPPQKTMPGSTLVNKSLRYTTDVQGRMICAAYAGGSSSSFTSWASAAPSWLEVVAIEAPGRGARIDDAMPTTDDDDDRELGRVCGEIIAVATKDRTPWALVGLSAGGLVVLEIYFELEKLAKTQRTAERALSRLRCLIIAGRAPPTGCPREPTDDEISEIYALADDKIRASETYHQVALPRLRADLRSDSRAEKRIFRRLEKADVDVVIVGGLDDPSFPPQDAAKWRPLASEIRFVPGGHDFIVHRFQDILTEATTRLRVTTTPEASSSTSSSSSENGPPLYGVEWEHVGEVDGPPEEPLDLVPTTRLSDVRRNVMDEKDDEILEETALDAVRRGVLILDGLADDDDSDWLARDEDTAWMLTLILKELEKRDFQRIEATLVVPASTRGALAAGAAKCARYELPIRIRRVYLRGEVEERDLLVRWAAHQASELDEDVLLWHAAGKWRAAVPRLRRIPPTDGHASRVIRGPKVLVTGATGGLGRVLVRWLEDDVGVEVIKVGRSSGDVVVDDLEKISEHPKLREERRISTIFHLAGALADATIGTMNRTQFAVPIQPKARGLIALKEAARRWGTTTIVAYSSTTSLFGFGGQTNYAAANALLDAYADFDDAPPRVISMQWGPWDAGMVSQKAMDLALRLGDKPLSPTVGLRCLNLALQSHHRHFAAFQIADWSRSPWRSLAATQHLQKDQPSVAALPQEEEEQDQVDAFLRPLVAKWLPEETLENLGLDSLDLAQMRSQATDLSGGKPVPMALFATPDLTLGDLANNLRDFLRGS